MKDTVSWLFFNQVDSIRIKGFGVTVNANVKETSVSAHKHSHTYTHTYIQKRRVLFQRSSFFFFEEGGRCIKVQSSLVDTWFLSEESVWCNRWPRKCSAAAAPLLCKVIQSLFSNSQ